MWDVVVCACGMLTLQSMAKQENSCQLSNSLENHLGKRMNLFTNLPLVCRRHILFSKCGKDIVILQTAEKKYLSQLVKVAPYSEICLVDMHV